MKITQLTQVPGGIFTGESLPDNSYQVSQVVALALMEDEDGRQEIRAVTLSEYGEITTTDWIEKLFIQDQPDSRVFNMEALKNG